MLFWDHQTFLIKLQHILYSRRKFVKCRSNKTVWFLHYFVLVYYNLESIFDKQLPFYNQMFMCQLNFICLVQNSKHNIIHRTRIHNATNKKVYTWTIICHVIWWDVYVTNISPYSYIFCSVLLFILQYPKWQLVGIGNFRHYFYKVVSYLYINYTTSRV